MINVPIFIVCAGNLCRKKTVYKFYLDKIKRILIPFWVFASLKIVYSNLISDEYAHGTSIWEQLYNSYIIGDVYWFCYAIFVIYLIAPFMWGNKGRRGIGIFGIVIGIIFAVLSIIIDKMNIPICNVFQIGKAIYYFSFFLTGYIINQYDDLIDEFVIKVGKLPYLVCLLTMFIFSFFSYFKGIWGINQYLLKIMASISLFLLAKEFLKNAPGKLPVQWLSKYSLQIMFMDAFYRVVLFKVINRIIPLSVFSLVIVCILDLTLCIVSCKIIEKIPYVRNLVGLS